MSRHSDRTDPGTAPPMGNAERLVQIQMTDIGAIGSWPAETDLGVQVGSVEIHLTSVLMDQVADPPNSGLKDSMR